MPTLKPGDSAPAFTLPDQNGKIAGAWYKVSPKDTVSKALEALEGKP
jgi:peroxiredoxin